ncbi:BnaCnng11690D [Brassica napus]|uniref:BnaCnng11690D protein n=1 Tax=Brassica napus TaxID=3708 RepID=A0A078I1A0_BRANA|nr:BnaCnng11690D [Brassica napus]
MPQSEVLNHPLSGLHSITESSVKPRRNTNQASKRLKPNLNTSGLTGHTSQCDTSIRQSNLSSKRTCSDIQATNLFKAFSTLEKTDNVNGMEFGAINLNLFEDQGSQIYDISSEEEDTNYDNNSESETECAPQQDQNVTTVPDEQRARIKTMASVFQSMFQDKPAKKGWSVSKRTVSKSKKKAAPPKQNMGYVDDGDPTHKCEHCGAIMWYGERIEKKRQTKKPKFSLCCGQDQVQLPLLKPLQENSDIPRETIVGMSSE